MAVDNSASIVCCLFASAVFFTTVTEGMPLATFPKPFHRALALQDPPLEGKDVVILQNLLLRSEYVRGLERTGCYDRDTMQAVRDYQTGNDLHSSGEFDVETATLALQQLMYDHYEDDGSIPPGYKFKVHIPVHKDRNRETIGTLYDDQNQTFDLNSKEPNPKSYGPYPVIRAVKGLEGNAAISSNTNETFISDIRSGILLHTGEWDHWNPSMPMPNSNGCIHVHPDVQKEIVRILVEKLGVVVRENPFGKNPYPYKPQGLLSIVQIADH